MTKDLNENDIQVIENGKVIERQSSSAYKVTKSDIQRVRERQDKIRQSKSTSRTKG